MAIIIFKHYIKMERFLTPNEESWMGGQLIERERNDILNAFVHLEVDGRTTVGESASPSGNLAAIYEYLQETSDYWASKPVNDLDLHWLKHKQAYNLVHHKTKGRRTRSNTSSPDRESSQRTPNADATVVPDDHILELEATTVAGRQSPAFAPTLT